MKIATPQDMTESELISSSVPLDDAPLWVSGGGQGSGGAYQQDDVVLFDRQVWKAASTTSDQPDEGAKLDPSTWIRQGWSNRWRMFKDGSDSKTEALGSIEVDIAQTKVNSVAALLGLQANSVTLTMTDPIEGVVFAKTVSLVDIGVANWWQWHFKPYETTDEAIFNLPPYPDATISVSVDGIAPSDTVKAGRFVMGLLRDLGVTVNGTSVSNLSYSKKDRDPFGNLVLLPRRTVKLVDYQVVVDTPRVSSVRSVLDKIDTTPTLFIGTDKQGFGATIVFGTIQDFRLVYSNPTTSDMTLTAEGF